MIKEYLNKLCRYSHWYKTSIFGDCEKFWNIPSSKLKIVNLGSNSGKYGFDYRTASVPAANWGVGPQPLMLDYAILQTYHTHLAPGAVVLIPLCPFSSLVGYDFSYLYDKYYSILPPNLIPCFNHEKAKEVLNIKNNPYQFIPLLAIIREIKFRILTIIHHKKEEYPSEKEQIQNAEFFINCWKNQFAITDFEAPLNSKNLQSYKDSQFILRNIVNFCHNHEYKPILILPPTTEYLSCKFSDKMRKLYIYDYLQEAVGSTVPFLNYFEDKELQNPKYFRNSFFLNQEGAVKFTTKVLNDLKLIK